jgi:pimeloyl-ACP methyl ester carboxylesterase/DNA-binding winged helix-turn-helix (wHTH) protein
LESQELLVSGEARPVEPQVFDLLCLFVKERGKLISRDELIKVVWSGRVVSDSAVSARINAARTAIGDDGARQEWIRTVPRRGFRFVGEVEVLPDQQSAGSGAGDSVSRQKVQFCRSSDGTRIAYGTIGSGPPLVKAGHWLTHLEHDWHSPVWRPFLEKLSGHYQVTRYDQRGNGLSDWDVPSFSLEHFVQDLQAVVDAAGLKRFALYGTSQGAAIAIAYAARHPDRVSHLILHGGYHKGRLLRISGAEREQGSAILTLIRHGWGKQGSPFIQAFATMFIPGGTREQLDSLAELQLRTTSPENAACIRAAIDTFDVTDLLPNVRLPTLVFHAREDGIQPLDQGRELADGIPGAEFVLLESRNHVLLPQEPAWVDFFAELDGFLARA